MDPNSQIVPFIEVTKKGVTIIIITHSITLLDYSGCLPNIFSQFQDFQGFFLNFLPVFQGFFGNFFACFQGSSKKFHQISTYRFRNFRTNLNIRRFWDTKWVIYHFLCNKLSFQGFQGFPLKNTCFSRFSRPPGLISGFKGFKGFKVRQPPCYYDWVVIYFDDSHYIKHTYIYIKSLKQLKTYFYVSLWKQTMTSTFKRTFPPAFTYIL